MEAKVKELEASLEAAQEEAKVLTAKVESERKVADELRASEERRVAGLMTKGLEGKIQAYNPAWNFVVISLGDRQGVVNGAEFVVKRGANAVGRIKVTSVEPSSSIADVLPSSIPSGEQIRPGDTIIVP